MKRLYLFIVTALQFFTAYSQNFWETVPAPDTINVYCVASRDNYIYMGSNGGVYISNDEGANWQYQQLDIYPFKMFYTIAIDDSGFVYTGSDYWAGHDALFRSKDHGQTWQSILHDSSFDGMIISINTIHDSIYVSFTGNTPILIRSNDGGESWETLFACESTNIFITGLERNSLGDLYITQRGAYAQQGGVYVSHDHGYTWEFSGLPQCMLTNVAINSSDDVFVSSWGGDYLEDAGIYVLRHGANNWNKLLEIQSQDLIFNEDDQLYVSSGSPDGAFRSLDNGETFEYIVSGLSAGPKGDLGLDEHGYLYICSSYSTNPLDKSVTTTVDVPNIYKNNELKIYPNPTYRHLNIEHSGLYPSIEIEIYNTLGVLIKKERIGTSPNTIELSSFAPGIYYIKVKNLSYSKKIVKL